MEAELQERVESSQKQASRVVEIYECLKSTVDQLKTELDSGAGEIEVKYSGGHYIVTHYVMSQYHCFSFQRALCGRQPPN